MPQSGAPSMPTLSGAAAVQPLSVDDGGSQARFRCPGTMPSARTGVAETVNASTRLAPRMPRRGKRSCIILLPAVAILRRGRHRDLHGGPLQHLLVEGVELRIGLAPAAFGEAEVGIAEYADQADLRDVERAVEDIGHVLEARHAGPGPIPMVVRPRLPLQALRPHHLLVAAQQHGIEHAVDQGMIGLGIPTPRTVIGDQAAAGHLVEVFDDDVGVQNDIAVIGDQHRQLFQRRDLRIVLVGRARRDGCRRELDLVDQPKLDRGDAHLAGEGRGGGEGELHGEYPKNESFASSLRGAKRRSNPGCLRRTISGLLRFARNDGVAAVMIPAYAATISWRCSPRPSMPSVMTSPTLRKVGGFMPRPTPGGVPVVMMSPGSSVMNCET